MRKTLISYIPLLCAVLLIGGMAGAADAFQNKEIIFPEIAAIATGALLTPKLAWRTDPLHIFSAIAVCALLGVCIVLWMPGDVWLQMSAAYLLASVLLLISRTSFAPMLSAAVLPVLLQTRSAVYLIAACFLTAGILLLRMILIRCNILTDTPFERLPEPDSAACVQTVIRWGIVTAVIFAALHCHIRYAAAPPLLVAFTEFWKPDAVARRRPITVTALLTLCGLCGAGVRYLLCVRFGILPCFAAGATMLAVFCIMKRLSLMLPPAAAIAVLAYLIPENALLMFPLQILCGITVLVGASYLYPATGAGRILPHSKTTPGS